MTLPARAALRGTLLLLLSVLTLTAACADGLHLTAAFGIGGRYRPGTWCPVTVSVSNPNGETESGQVQVLASPMPGRSGGGNASLSGALFARPVSLSSAAAQQFMVYTRGVDPGRDSVTVQLAEGFKRGDGRVAARTDNDPTNNAPTITGMAVRDNDFFFVGFAGGLGAFSYLNGQKVNLVRQPGGTLLKTPQNPIQNRYQNANIPGAAQVASPSTAELPDKAAGYSGVDAFLLRSDAPLDALTEAQAKALKGWVASGGHLVVLCTGIDPSPFASPFYSGLLPATVGPAGAVGRLTLVRKPLPGLAAVAGVPFAVTGPYGAGRVTMTTSSNLTAEQMLLMAGRYPASLLAQVAVREENYGSGYYGYGQTLLSDAVMRAPSLDAPGTEVIGLFLLAYLIVLVPVNYIVLKRMDRKELAWVTIPLLVVLFAGGTFGVGYAAKGGTVFLNRASILETGSGHREAGVYSELGLFSPHRTSYDIQVPGANFLAALPNPGNNYNYRSQRSGGEVQSNGQTKFVQIPEGTALLDTSINMWAMRAFDTQSTTDLGGSIDSSLADRTGGSVTNHTKYGLTDCVLVYENEVHTLGSFAPGATLPVLFNGVGIQTISGLALPALPGEANFDESHSDVRRRMHLALVGYIRSLGTQDNNNGQATPAYTPSPNEALLIGWSDDPALAGPAPQIDGHSVRENDASVVIVHLPIEGK